jgi:hypothetical protein
MLSALASATTAVYVNTGGSKGEALQPPSASEMVKAQAVVAAQWNSLGLTVSKARPMTQADVHAFEDAPSLADKNRSDAGSSGRLGNLIDIWWHELNFPNVSRQLANEEGVPGQYDAIVDIPRNTFFTYTTDFGWERRATFANQCPNSGKCFGLYLVRTVRPSAQALRPDNIKVIPQQPDARIHAEMHDRFEKLKPGMYYDYAIYRPNVVREYMIPGLTHDLSTAFHNYATENAPELLEPPAHDAVVHYRLGDALRNELPIAPESIAAALASLDPQPKTIEVLSGGFNFGGTAGLTLPKARARASAHILKLLSDEILKVLPDAQVTMPTRRSLDTSTIDGDWAKLVTAKSMVAGAGSFGLSAAAARNHSDPTKQTRTAAYYSGIYPCTKPLIITNNMWVDDPDYIELQMLDAIHRMNATTASTQEKPGKVRSHAMPLAAVHHIHAMLTCHAPRSRAPYPCEACILTGTRCCVPLARWRRLAAGRATATTA